jgi:hypothetical protein
LRVKYLFRFMNLRKTKYQSRLKTAGYPTQTDGHIIANFSKPLSAQTSFRGMLNIIYSKCLGAKDHNFSN